jgi:hypothetical protein
MKAPEVGDFLLLNSEDPKPDIGICVYKSVVDASNTFFIEFLLMKSGYDLKQYLNSNEPIKKFSRVMRAVFKNGVPPEYIIDIQRSQVDLLSENLCHFL